MTTCTWPTGKPLKPATVTVTEMDPDSDFEGRLLVPRLSLLSPRLRWTCHVRRQGHSDTPTSGCPWQPE